MAATEPWTRASKNATAVGARHECRLIGRSAVRTAAAAAAAATTSSYPIAAAARGAAVDVVRRRSDRQNGRRTHVGMIISRGARYSSTTKRNGACVTRVTMIGGYTS